MNCSLVGCTLRMSIKKIQNVHNTQQGNTKGKKAYDLRQSKSFSSEVCRTQMFSVIISLSLDHLQMCGFAKVECEGKTSCEITMKRVCSPVGL